MASRKATGRATDKVSATRCVVEQFGDQLTVTDTAQPTYLQASFLARRVSIAPALLPVVTALVFGEVRT